MDDDLVFSINAGSGAKLNVYVTGQPEDYRVLISDPDRDAMIGIDKCDWERIVARVQEQF
jgi:hypothetical protein